MDFDDDCFREDMEADGNDYAEEQRRAYLETLTDEDGNPLYEFEEED